MNISKLSILFIGCFLFTNDLIVLIVEFVNIIGSTCFFTCNIKTHSKAKFISKMNLIDPLILNNGFHLIAEEIFNKLDFKSLAKSRQVSKLWKEFIDNNRVLLIHQVRQAKQLRITKRLGWKKIVKRQLKRQKCEDFDLMYRIWSYVDKNSQKVDLGTANITLLVGRW